MTTKELAQALHEAAGWLSELPVVTLEESVKRDRIISAIMLSATMLAPSVNVPGGEPERETRPDPEGQAEAYARFQNLEEVKAAIESGMLSPETAYDLERAGRARASYLAYFKKLMGE